jgi:hypothetical protein
MPILFALTATGYCASPYSWATYYATRRAVPIRIDGDVSEWQGAKAVPLDEEKYFFVGQGMSSAKWGGAKDLSAEFRVLWDTEYIYVAVEVADDRVTEPHGSLVPGTETGSWDDDGVELMFDNDGCGMPQNFIGDPVHHEFHYVYSGRRPLVFDNFWKPEPGAPAPQFKLSNGRIEPLAYPGDVMAKNEVTDRFSSGPYRGAFAFRKTMQGYNLEVRMALPGARMAAINEGGHSIGFDIAINDNDTGSGPLKQQLHWSGMNDMFWRNSQFFGTLILLNR